METFAQVTGPREDNPDHPYPAPGLSVFDPIVVEMAAAVLAGHPGRRAADGLRRRRPRGGHRDHGVTEQIIITPTVLAAVDLTSAGQVEHLVSAVRPAHRRWSNAGPPAAIFNVYGPASAGVGHTRACCGQAGHHRPRHRRIHHLRPRHPPAPGPAGVVGELYLSAPALARGYLNKPAATVTSFVADPFDAPGARMYATGDLVRVNASGDLEYAGRADHQVKVSGQRIELGEIEAVLTDQPGITQALVLGVGDAASGRTRLVGYVVAPDGADVDAVLSAAASTLPAYGARAADRPRCDAADLGGKLDRAALPRRPRWWRPDM